MAPTNQNKGPNRVTTDPINNNNIFKKLVENSFSGITLFNRDLDIIYRTPSAAQIIGFNTTERVQASINDLTHPDDRQMVSAILNEVLSSPNEPKLCQFRALHANGKYIWLECRFTNMFHEKDINAVVCNFIDVTDRVQAEADLKNKTRQMETLLDSITDGFIALDENLRYVYVNRAVSKMVGMPPDAMIGKKIWDLFPDAVGSSTWQAVQTAATERKYVCNEDYYAPLNLWQENRVYPADNGVTMFIRDITSSKQEEQELMRLNERISLISNATNVGLFEWDFEGKKSWWSESQFKLFGFDPGHTPPSREDWLAKLHPESREKVNQVIEDIHQNGLNSWEFEVRYARPDGKTGYLLNRGTVERNEHKVARSTRGYYIDITEQKNAELAAMQTLLEKNTILESIGDAFFAVDKNWVVNYWNNTATKVLFKSKEEMLGQNLWDIFVDAVNSTSYKNYHRAMATRQAVHFEDHYAPLKKWYEVSAYPGESGLSVYFKDITDRKEVMSQLRILNDSLQRQTRELAISNAELEQFAYVASHDLQEPLRMVTGFLTQLEKKYNHIIDNKGKQYIHFAVDGAKRMRQIILDLLEFSRVGRSEDLIEEVDTNKIVYDVMALFRKKIEEKSARIIFNNLPVIRTYKVPVREVFQNLIGNSLKYHQPGKSPLIYINCEEDEAHFVFSIKDNGIGIDHEYFDKIFIIFQRLHHKDEYPGTGMGLAITKKILENQGGRIWLESEEGEGSTFYFTITKHHNHETGSHFIN